MNPLLNALQGQISPIQNNNVKNIVNVLKVAKNPLYAVSQLSQTNPEVANIIKMCEGRDPKDVFYSECQRRGVNPDDILNQIK